MPFRPQFRARPPAQRGYVMVLSIIMLLVITLLTVSMAKSFFFEEGMASNTREKNRSFAAAQAGLNYAENLIAQGLPSAVSATCSGAPQATLQVCYAPATIVTTSNTSPLASYFVVPTSALPSSYINISTGITKDSFYAMPGFYIQNLGVEQLTGAFVYRITSYGYGATPNSVSILQSTYEVHSGATPPCGWCGY